MRCYFLFNAIRALSTFTSPTGNEHDTIPRLPVPDIYRQSHLSDTCEGHTSVYDPHFLSRAFRHRTQIAINLSAHLARDVFKPARDPFRLTCRILTEEFFASGATWNWKKDVERAWRRIVVREELKFQASLCHVPITSHPPTARSRESRGSRPSSSKRVLFMQER